MGPRGQKEVTQNAGRAQEESEENSFKPETGALSWLLDDPHEREISKEEQEQQIRSVNYVTQSTARIIHIYKHRMTREFHKPKEV